MSTRPVIDGEGSHMLECVKVRNNVSGTTEILKTDAFFVLIGALPHTDWLAGSIQCDKAGFILTGRDLETTFERRPLRFETSLPGVFAAGDVRHGSVKSVASAVGEGSVALHFIHDYLKAPVEIHMEQLV